MATPENHECPVIQNGFRTEEELRALAKEVFLEEIRQIFTIYQESTAAFSESHRLEHDFIKKLIEHQAHKTKFYHDLSKQITGWGVIGLIGAIGAWVMDNLHHTTK
jgi:hypothetical protein